MKVVKTSLLFLIAIIGFVSAQEKPELLLSRGHSGQTRVIAEALSPDLRFAYTVGSTGDIKVWSLETGQVLRTISDPKAYPDPEALGVIHGATFSPRGDWVATVDEQAVLRRFSLPSGKLISSFKSPSKRVILRTDGRSIWLVTPSLIEKRSLDGTLEASVSNVALNRGLHSADLSSDGQSLAVAGTQELTLFQAQELKPLVTRKLTRGGLGLAFSPDGSRLAVTSGAEVTLHQLPDLSVTGTVSFENDPVRTPFWAAGEVYVYSFEYAGLEVLARCDFASSELELLDDDFFAASAVETPDSRVFFGGYGGKAWLFDPVSGGRQELSRDIGGYTAFTLGGESSDLFTGSRRGDVVRWSRVNGRNVQKYEGLGSWVASLEVSPDGTKLLGGGYSDGRVVCWDIESGKQLSVVDLKRGGFGNGIRFAKWADSERYLYSAPERDLTLVEAETGRELNSWPLNGLNPSDIAVREGRIVAGYPKNQILEADLLNKRDVAVTTIPKRIIGSVEEVAYGSSSQEVFCLDIHGDLYRWLPMEQDREPEFLAHFDNPVDNLDFTDEKLRLWFRNGEIRELNLSGKQVATKRLADDNIRSGLQVGDKVVAIADYFYLSFYDAGTGSRKGRLVGVLDNAGWLALEESGSFDGNDVGLRTIKFSLGDELYGVEQFLNQYFRPGILADLLPETRKGLRTAKPLTVSTVTKPPAVRILEPISGEQLEGEQVIVTIEVKANEGGASEPSLYHNGHKLPQAGMTKRDGSTFSYRVDLVSGQNEFQASAFDALKTVESRRDRVRVQAPHVKDRPPKLHLLSVGVDNYSSGLKLEFATADAESISKLFQTDLYSEGSRVLLANDEATRERIREAIEQIAATAEPQDAFVLYLAGHGTVVEDTYYFMPRDVETESDKALQETAFSSRELSELLVSVPATKQLLVLDTCRAGQFVQDGLLAREGLEEVRSHNQLSRTSGTFLVAATKEKDYAYEVPELGHGILTYSVLESLGLKEGAGSSSPVTANGLLYSVSQKVPELSQKYHGTRQMVVQYSSGQDFPLTK